MCFYSLERWFLVLEYRKTHFAGLYCLKKEKLVKWPFLDQKHGLTLWKYVNFLTFWTFRFYSLEKCLLVLEYRKTHFPRLYSLKKKVGKMAIFGQKPWVNPFGKMSIFRLFELFFLYPRKVFFGSIISEKTFSWPILPKKKRWKHSHFWTKMSNFRLLKLCVSIA